tara:strand:+ start:437 stop:802 length:366 start_codon:yes stop_codon:yes gene_type:complete
MNQIYTERVLINGDEPPKLNYQLYLFLVIDIILNLFLFAFSWAVVKSYRNNNTTINNIFISQYAITLVITFILSLTVSSMMYTKKYFLYKDDGLRAIRALQLINFRIGAIVCSIPMFLMLN